jgi:hypothetical protein
MNQNPPLLLPNQAALPHQPRRVFADGIQLAQFRQTFHEAIRPELDQLKKARQASEQDAKSQWVR